MRLPVPLLRRRRFPGSSMKRLHLLVILFLLLFAILCTMRLSGGADFGHLSQESSFGLHSVGGSDLPLVLTILLLAGIIAWNVTLKLQVKQRTRDLDRELEERGRVEEALQRLLGSLEDRVSERTKALTESNAKLKREISERARAEEALRHTLSLLAATFESTADGILAVDTDGMITNYNRRFMEISGVPEALLSGGDGGPVREFVRIQVKDRESFVKRIAEIRAHPKGESKDLLEFRDGRTVESMSRPQFVGEAIVGRVWSFRDITEQRRLENQLLQSQKMESVGTLAGGIAHDFNNILTVIIGCGELMRMKLPPSSPVEQYLVQIMEVAERAALLTRSLLAFSRKQLNDPVKLNINRVVESVGSLLPRIIGEDVEIIVEAAVADLCVRADKGQIEQVLMNLAGNARDAMPDGGSLTISTGFERLDRPSAESKGLSCGLYATITVADTGSGMEPSVRERIFEPFFTTKGVGKGTGLGLSMAYGIVRQHDGAMVVESTPGKGSIFRIYLPLMGGGVEKPCTAFKTPAGGNETILLVEDDELVRRTNAGILEAAGYRVVTAAGGEEALGLFADQGEYIDLILMDVIMPKKDGRQVYLDVTKIRPGMKCIFMSGYTADVLDRKGMLDGTYDFVAKPATQTVLLSTVRRVLDTPAATGGAA